jgi:hypothetical protein
MHHIGKKKAKVENNPQIESEYKGSKGWGNIKKEVITLRTLRNDDIPLYDSLLDRMLYFPFAYNILNNPEIVAFSPLIVKKKTLIKVDFMLFSTNKKVRMHIGVRKEGNTFVPITFLVEYVPKHETFIERQKIANVIKITITPISDSQEMVLEVETNINIV